MEKISLIKGLIPETNLDYKYLFVFINFYFLT